MEKPLFIVRTRNGLTLYAGEHTSSSGMMQCAKMLIEAYSRLGAFCCEIWLRPEHHKMILLGTAF